MATRRTSKTTTTTSRSGQRGPGKRPPKPPPGGASAPPPPADEGVALHELAQTRYLNYALSVITSRALPDVRDGLKPVQRRILYSMWQDGLRSDAKHRKSANVVGAVMGAYHPHGDSSIYDALVRLAQPFSMRLPLVDGSGNFGSLDGDPPAAYRYTECRLTAVSSELLGEISQNTVPFRPNYDGTKFEPVVLPSKLPNLLVNGVTGIAVGMATNIPPHNPEEVVNASLRLLDALVEGRDLSNRELCRTIKGPDFPTGGQIVSGTEEIKAVYENGQGSIKTRATWRLLEAAELKSRGKDPKRANTIVEITSIPYTVNKATLVERIADVVTSRKMPLLLDVRDVSGEDVSVELEIKKDADVHKVLAYLFKQTPLQTSFNVNMTCLVPTENPEVGRPERLDLSSLLWHFLHFRLDVVTRRLEHELRALQKRIHVLEGFETVFDALDEILRIIRRSDGKADAAKKIMAKFPLDAEQTDAILELKLYRLAKLEILVIRQELADKRKRSKEIDKLLKSDETQGRWQIVRGELTDVLGELGGARKRRTIIEEVEAEPEFSAEDLIVAEDNHVLLTRDGWVKRQREIKDPQNTRLREGDGVLACVAGSTRATVVFFSSYGTAYTCRIVDIPATTGYGEPIQKLFKLKDGEAIIAAMSLDRRVVGDLSDDPDYFPETFAVAAASNGFAATFGLHALADPSTKNGRRYMRVAEDDKVIDVQLVHGDEILIAASRMRRALLCPVSEVNFLAGAGKGVTLVKLEKNDALIGVKVARDDRDTLTVKTSIGGEQRINTAKYEVASRGGKGREVIKRGTFIEVLQDPVGAPAPLDGADE